MLEMPLWTWEDLDGEECRQSFSEGMEGLQGLVLKKQSSVINSYTLN